MSAEFARCRVRHAVFTNAPGADGVGLRITGVGGWSELDRSRLQEWLGSIRPRYDATSQSFAYATRTLPLNESRYVCLATAGQDIGVDEHGRPGARLVHALMAEVPNEDLCHHAAGLYQRSREIRAVAARNLDDFIGRHCQEIEIDCPFVEPCAIATLPDEFLSAFLTVAENKQNGGFFPVPVRPGDDIAQLAIVAAAALPPVLRLGLDWAAGVDDSYVGKVLLSRAPTTDAGGFGQWSAAGTAYPKWLRAQLALGGVRAVRDMSEDWSVKSWKIFRERIASPVVDAQPDPMARPLQP